MYPMSDAEVDWSARAWYASEYEAAVARHEEHAAEVHRILSRRGRWLLVYEDGGAIRHTSKRRARGQAASARGFGIPARVIRYQRGRVTLNEELPQLEVNDIRWLP